MTYFELPVAGSYDKDQLALLYHSAKTLLNSKFRKMEEIEVQIAGLEPFEKQMDQVGLKHYNTLKADLTVHKMDITSTIDMVTEIGEEYRLALRNAITGQNKTGQNKTGQDEKGATNESNQ
jgi:adenylate cyclase class IV